MTLSKSVRETSLEELRSLPSPGPTGSYFPQSHSSVLQMVLDALLRDHISITRTQFLLMRGNARFLGVLDTGIEMQKDVANAVVVVSNSTDKSLPHACFFATRLPNHALSFSKKLASLKHTQKGESRFQEAISNMGASVREFAEVELKELISMRGEQPLSPHGANSIMLQAFEHLILSHSLLRKLLKQWRTPPERFSRGGALCLHTLASGILMDYWMKNPTRMIRHSFNLRKLILHNIQGR